MIAPMRCRGAAALALVVCLGVTASCSSDSDPEDRPGINEAVAAIPEAQARTGFVISDDEAIIGGGGERNVAAAEFSASRQLWLLESDGSIAELPDLPGDGFVEGLSGVRIDEWIVVGGVDCIGYTGATTGLLGCSDPMTRAMWARRGDDGDWNRYVVDEPMEPAGAPGGTFGIYAGNHVRVLGAHDDRALVAFVTGHTTSFAAFAPASGDIEMLGEAPTTLPSISTQPFCTTADGEILHARIHQEERSDQAAGGHAEMVSVSRLSVDGSWTDGPAAKVGDIAGDINVSTVDIDCFDERDPLLAVSLQTSHGIDSGSPDGQLVIEATPPVLASVSRRTLEVTTQHDITDELKRRSNELAELRRASDEMENYEGTITFDGFLAVEGQTPAGDLIIRSDGGFEPRNPSALNHRLYTVKANGAVAELDQFGNVPHRSTVFVYGGMAGWVEFHEGDIRVEPIDA